MALGFSDPAALGEAKAQMELHAALQLAGEAAVGPTPSAQQEGRQLVVIGEPISIHGGGRVTEIPPGNPQRLVGVLVANGGSVTIDQISEALWPGDPVDKSRNRLRNVLLRLRRVVGDVVVRTGSGLRLAPGLACDLHAFERLATDALSAARADPELAGELAERAVAAGDGPAFVDFEYEEWAITARRRADQQMITLLDLLSVQAEDAGDLPVAQALAERALRLDPHADSRYVRLAELLTMQNRVAAALAVLDDAAAVAREIGDGSPGATKQRRQELLRQTATGL
jgi:DNA-binding SARP family transcriptional activator